MEKAHSYMVKNPEHAQWGLLLDSLCVVDADSDDAVAKIEALQDPDVVEALSVCPIQQTNKGRHYLFILAQSGADAEGYWDGARQVIGFDADLKTRCSTGTRGVLAICPSLNKTWVREPWAAGTKLVEIPRTLMELVAKPKQTKQKKQRSIKVVVNDDIDHESGAPEAFDEVAALVDIIAASRASSYRTWMEVGWCLHNISPTHLPLWELFSKKCPEKYTKGKCGEVWGTMNSDDRAGLRLRLRLGSLHMWARHDSPVEYWDIVRNIHYGEQNMRCFVDTAGNCIVKCFSATCDNHAPACIGRLAEPGGDSWDAGALHVNSRYIDIDACLEMKQAVDVWLDPERKDVNTLSVRSPMGGISAATFSVANRCHPLAEMRGLADTLNATTTGVVTMDATWGSVTKEFLKQAGLRNLLVVNDYRSTENARTFSISKDEVTWSAQIRDDITAGRNVVVVSLSQERAMQVHKVALDTFDDPKDAARLCLLHTSKTADSVKAKLIDVDALWSSKRIVVYTPTISAGIDFSTEHFDRMYLYLCPGSTGPVLFCKIDMTRSPPGLHPTS
eukprot:gene9501-biopygen8044